MGNPSLQMVKPEQFNYALLHGDVARWCKYHQTTMQDISQNTFYRSGSFVSNGLSKKTMTLPVIMKLCEMIGEDLKKYEVKPKPEPKPVIEPEPVVTEPAAQDVPEWELRVMVSPEFNSSAVKLMHNGEELAIGRSYLYGKDLVGIAQSLSYSTHMIYKLLQQRKIADKGFQDVSKDAEIEAEMEQAERSEPEPDDGPTVEQMADRRLIFKDWVKRYESANSSYGRFARYVNSHYPHFPATSEKKMRYYLRLNGGDTHIQAFDVLFQMYRHQDRQQFVEQNRRDLA